MYEPPPRKRAGARMRKLNVSKLSMELAAQAWCTPDCAMKIMDATLAMSFAEILNREMSKPSLGMATTRELIAELSARSNLDYKTVQDETIPPPDPIQPRRDAKCECGCHNPGCTNDGQYGQVCCPKTPPSPTGKCICECHPMACLTQKCQCPCHKTSPPSEKCFCGGSDLAGHIATEGHTKHKPSPEAQEKCGHGCTDAIYNQNCQIHSPQVLEKSAEFSAEVEEKIKRIMNGMPMGGSLWMKNDLYDLARIAQKSRGEGV